MAYSQLNLPLENAIESRVERSHFHVARSTFLGGLATKVHRWFRLTPSFGPELVRKALADMGTTPNSVILDPFAGAGTTLIEAKLEGHHGIGFELNPILHFVCKTSMAWDLDPMSLRHELIQIQRNFSSQERAADNLSLAETGLAIPPIHNVYRWWRQDVLKHLIILLQAIEACSKSPKHKAFFELALAGVLVPDLTNVTLGRLQLHFIDRSSDDIQVWDIFHNHALTMIFDLEEIEMSLTSTQTPESIFHTDATDPELPADLPLADRVITSPPYPNRYSYVWNTRPHLYLFGLFQSAKEASNLDLKTIGGTWGTATSILAKGKIDPAHRVIATHIQPVVEKIRNVDNLMANYVMKYFNKLADQIVSQDHLLANEAQLAYIVGCSRIKDVYIETDVLLGKLFEGLDLGYQVRKIERFRRRHSGKDLHESAVYVIKN